MNARELFIMSAFEKIALSNDLLTNYAEEKARRAGAELPKDFSESMRSGPAYMTRMMAGIARKTPRRALRHINDTREDPKTEELFRRVVDKRLRPAAQRFLSKKKLTKSYGLPEEKRQMAVENLKEGFPL